MIKYITLTASIMSCLVTFNISAREICIGVISNNTARDAKITTKEPQEEIAVIGANSYVSFDKPNTCKDGFKNSGETRVIWLKSPNGDWDTEAGTYSYEYDESYKFQIYNYMTSSYQTLYDIENKDEYTCKTDYERYVGTRIWLNMKITQGEAGNFLVEYSCLPYE